MQVLFTWLEGIISNKLEMANHKHLKSDCCMTTRPSRLLEGCEQIACAVETPCRRKRISRCDLWSCRFCGEKSYRYFSNLTQSHKTRIESHDWSVRKLRHIDDFFKLLAVKKRLLFIAEVCSFHRYNSFSIFPFLWHCFSIIFTIYLKHPYVFSLSSSSFSCPTTISWILFLWITIYDPCEKKWQIFMSDAFLHTNPYLSKLRTGNARDQAI